MSIDITEYPELVEYMNKLLSAGDIIEVKRESGNTITVVRIDRKLAVKVKTDESKR